MPIDVVCGIIRKQGKILIARRKPEKALGGYWEFPGGKLETGEREEDALGRELIEELGMEVQVVKRLEPNVHRYERGTINLIPFLCDFIQTIEVSFADHDRIEWVTKEELLEYNLAPADIPVAENLLTMDFSQVL